MMSNSTHLVKSISQVFIFFIVSGCANITTLDRHTDVKFSELRAVKDENGKVVDYEKIEQTGRVIHLDAKQRVVIQKPYGIICAEPSPDALSAVAASASGSIAPPSKGDIALANALSEQAGSIGLRTQTIQLMRDALYRVCEAYYSRALGDIEVMMLHQKYQDVMVAVLAIEQLTGAIKAQQVTLQGDASANALARSYDLTKAMAEAREEISKLEAAQLDLAQTKKQKQKNYDTAKAARDAAPASEVAINNFTEAEAELNNASNQLADNGKAIIDKKDYLAVLEDSKNAALTTAKSSAKGAASFGADVVNNRLSDQAAQHVSESVVKIVKKVVEKNYIVESCFAVISNAEEILNSANKFKGVNNLTDVQIEKKEIAKRQNEILNVCVEQIKKSLSQYQKADDSSESAG